MSKLLDVAPQEKASGSMMAVLTMLSLVKEYKSMDFSQLKAMAAVM